MELSVSRPVDRPDVRQLLSAVPSACAAEEQQQRGPARASIHGVLLRLFLLLFSAHSVSAASPFVGCETFVDALKTHSREKRAKWNWGSPVEDRERWAAAGGVGPWEASSLTKPPAAGIGVVLFCFVTCCRITK